MIPAASSIPGNGALAGLVAITGGCAFVDTWAAMTIGFIAGGIYYAASKFILHRLMVRLGCTRAGKHGLQAACGTGLHRPPLGPVALQDGTVCLTPSLPLASFEQIATCSL